MYDELVKRLRRYVEIERSEHHGADLEAKAADAIEELSKKVDEWQEEACKWNSEYYHLLDNMPRWIPVTERLPEDGRFLALTTPYIGSSEPVVRILRFSKNLESVNKYDFEGISRNGWYVYDDEYGYIEVDDVTHWMPLPEPPEEKT